MADFLANTYLGLTPTDKLILLTLADRVSGMRIEEIASAAGSRFRWVAREISKLTDMGIVRRVGPGTYALTDDDETKL